LRRILQGHTGQRVALVCHGGVIRGLLSILLELPLRKMAAFEIDYASLTQVVWTPPLARLHLVNFAPWRELRE
ncbi:MAG TPA: histidine phosphatase family protein, partial [Verrucomicrobiae bacterium]|nr:histidine phosphatase family protein [Verrucomicrobiae bacterium]